MDLLPLVYRCAVAIKPQQPLLDWLNAIDPADNPPLTELQEDNSLYLVPDYEDEADMEKAIEKYLKANYTRIFINELSDWYLDPTLYPQMTYPIFLKWFDITVHTMIYDMVDQPLTKD